MAGFPVLANAKALNVESPATGAPFRARSAAFLTAARCFSKSLVTFSFQEPGDLRTGNSGKDEIRMRDRIPIFPGKGPPQFIVGIPRPRIVDVQLFIRDAESEENPRDTGISCAGSSVT